jgi:predicted ATP-dependent endonuclease of OLD family
MQVYLSGLRLKNYRGIGAKDQSVAPLKKCNFFIGTNNSGKSCILNFIAGHLDEISKIGSSNPQALDLSELEIHQGAVISQVEISVAQPLSVMTALGIKRLSERGCEPTGLPAKILIKLLEKMSQHGLIWATVNADNLNANA